MTEMTGFVNCQATGIKYITYLPMCTVALKGVWFLELKWNSVDMVLN